MGLVISMGLLLFLALMAQQEGYGCFTRIMSLLQCQSRWEVLFQMSLWQSASASIAIGSIHQFFWLGRDCAYINSHIRIFSALILAICLMIPTLREKSWKRAKLVLIDSKFRIKNVTKPWAGGMSPWWCLLGNWEHDFIIDLGAMGGKSTF